MKYYLLEPKYKKSLVEGEWYEREDGAKILVQTTWRTGSFKLTVPETESEMKELLGDAYDEDDVEYYAWLPEEDDDYIELDDYQFEMLSTWDGCSEDHEVFKVEDEDEAEAITEALDEHGISGLWDEEGVLEGFHADYCFYEIHGGCVLTECDEDGQPLEEQE